MLLISSHCFCLWQETSLNQSVIGCISYNHSLLCVNCLENYCPSFIDFLLTVTGTVHKCQVVLVLLWKQIKFDEINQNNYAQIFPPHIFIKPLVMKIISLSGFFQSVPSNVQYLSVVELLNTILWSLSQMAFDNFPINSTAGPSNILQVGKCKKFTSLA